MMEKTIKKACPSCSQYYSIKCPQQPKGRMPLLLKCGHSCCELCLRNTVKFSEPVECKVCQREMEIAKDMTEHDFNAQFPVNLNLLGELALQSLDSQKFPVDAKEGDCFVNLKEIIASTEGAQGNCMECKAPTSKLCKECDTTLCESCFKKIHKFHMFRNHVLTTLEDIVEPNNCKEHTEKHLDYYCKDCSKAVCMDCMIVGGDKSCKNHDVISVQDVNDVVVEELNDLMPRIDETYRRLTKTAVVIGHQLKSIESGGASDLDTLQSEVQQHFSKLHAAIQKHEQETIKTINNLRNIELKSLCEAKASVTESIKKSLVTIRRINAVMTSQNRNKCNLTALLDDAKAVINSPWHLVKDEKKQDLKVTVNEDLCGLISDYVHLEGNGSPTHALLPADRIDAAEMPPAPAAPVFPPDIVRDVREGMMKPAKPKAVDMFKSMEPASMFTLPRQKYKSGSNSSLSSIGDSSYARSMFSMKSDNSHAPVVSVSPYTEVVQPKPLIEGSQEVVYISHIVSPGDFYVQRAAQQGLVKEMMRDFRNAASLPRPKAAHLAEGKTYLAFNATDNDWQRCRVLSVDREALSCTVLCIDFGSVEVVPADKLRLLPSARLAQPPLAAACALHNCAPRHGAWAADDAVLMQRVIDNSKRVLLRVRRVVRGAAGERLVVDLTTLEHGVSLLRALIFHERANMMQPDDEKPAFVPGLAERPRLIESSCDFKLKTPEQVTITHVVSPDNFYVRRCYFQETYDKLCEEMNDYYWTGDTSGIIHCPEVGMLCAVNTEGGWRRALVLETPGRLRARLRLPDCGAAAVVPHSALRHIRPDFARLKALATECHLSGITPHKKRWSSASVALLNQYVNKEVTLVPEERKNRGSLGVTLMDGEECVNTLMVRYKFAVSFGLYTFNEKNPIGDQNYTLKALDKVEGPKPKPKLKILKRNEELPEANAQDLQAKDKGPLKLEVKVLSCHSPSLLYVSLIDQAKRYYELYDAIQEHYANNKTKAKTEWAVGESCCTVYQVTKTWRRAVVVTLADDKATVFFSDFAVVDTVPLSELRELDPKFAAIGDGAIKCHLCGIAPALGGDWPSLTKEFLRELLDAYQRIFITKKGVIKDRSLPVEVWVYHIIEGGALEPNSAEWRCLNKKIIEQGLAIPDQVLADSEKKGDEDDMITIFNITGSVREWLQLDERKPEPARSPSPSSNADSDDKVQPVTNCASDWLPAEPLESREFTAVPTYVDSEGHIFLHDAQQQGTLELIRNALELRFGGPRAPKPPKAPPVPGRACVARFYLDGRFYRARVLDAEPDAALVRYVDYGNEERCLLEDLRAQVVLHEIPVQAHECRLARLVPQGGRWAQATLDYVHKAIVEKSCLVRVAGEPVDGVVPIDLKYDKLWLADHLVDFELAIRVDDAPSRARRTPELATSPPLSDSGPDFIVVDEVTDRSGSTVTLADRSAKADWNEMLDEEKETDMFPENDVGEEFDCTVLFVDIENEIFELAPVLGEETDLAYKEMFAALQTVGPESAAVKRVDANRACLAQYGADGLWYRASMMQFDEDNNLVNVKYVDYGNCEVIPLDEIRELGGPWLALPPRTISARLDGFELNVEADLEELEKTFLTKMRFHARVVDKADSVLTVELIGDDGSLPLECLLEKGVLIRTKSVD